jgi:hypothetical protein
MKPDVKKCTPHISSGFEPELEINYNYIGAFDFLSSSRALTMAEVTEGRLYAGKCSLKEEN